MKACHTHSAFVEEASLSSFQNPTQQGCCAGREEGRDGWAEGWRGGISKSVLNDGGIAGLKSWLDRVLSHWEMRIDCMNLS